MFEYRPVPKPSKKEKPEKIPMSRTARKVKKAKREEKAKREGIKVPSAKVRNSFTDKEYQEAIEIHGTTCFMDGCGKPMAEMHHVTFRSDSGRGKRRNACPLCKDCHDKAHKVRKVADLLRDAFTFMYGEHYHKDEYDLWFAGLIEEPTKQAYEEFMKKEEERCQQKVLTHKEVLNRDLQSLKVRTLKNT